MPKDNHSREICDPRGTGRNDQKCSACQDEIRRATKTDNNYRTHGPRQTVAGRMRARAVKEVTA